MANEKSAKQVIQEECAKELAAYGNAVEKMSHRQLSAELKRVANKGYDGKAFSMPAGMDFAELGASGKSKKIRTCAGLDNALAVVLRVVLENTKTSPVFDFKKDGITPKRTARKDQIGKGTMSFYLR